MNQWWMNGWNIGWMDSATRIFNEFNTAAFHFKKVYFSVVPLFLTRALNETLNFQSWTCRVQAPSCGQNGNPAWTISSPRCLLCPAQKMSIWPTEKKKKKMRQHTCCEVPAEGENTLMSIEKKAKRNLINSWLKSCSRCGTDVNTPICVSFCCQ